ncbi:MAG: hypothetical protein D3916_07665, partial [Candidatus Electrothrix sp. MAN1_4]|nr:hypothetical protein [Candidatus Electrothrix sp. MAN1_4]
EGIAVLDESDRARCKRTKRIHKAYKQRDKKTGGYVNGQTVILLLLVTDSITFPVGFKFYMPDPAQTAWKKEDEKLRKKGVPKKKRPVSPEPDPEYPTKQDLALELLKEFLTVTFLGEQADWIIKAEISRARNQQFMLMLLFQMTCKGFLMSTSTC